MMYRDNTTKMRNDQWIRKYKPEIWKNYYVGELEVIPKSNLPQILTLTRYNLTYYPKYLNTTEMKSLTASYKFTDSEAISRLIWFGTQSNDFQNRGSSSPKSATP